MKIVDPTSLTDVLTLADFKSRHHVLETDDDTVLTGYVAAARRLVERASRRPMLPRDVEFITPVGDWTRWWFPVAPVQSVASLQWRDDTGQWQALTGTPILEDEFNEPVLVLPDGARSEAGLAAIKVTASVGFASDDIPEDLVVAIGVIAWEWHKRAISLGPDGEGDGQFGAANLIAHWRYRRPQLVGY